MTGTNFASLIRTIDTKTNNATLPDADLVLLMNAAKDNLAELIVANVDEGYFLAEDVRDLEAGVRNYTYPTDWLKSTRYVSAKLDGTNWKLLDEIDYGYINDRQLALREETLIQKEFSTKKPRYYFHGTELVILSGSAIEDVTGGLKLVSEVYPEDFTEANLSSDTDLSIPSSNTSVRLPRSAHNALRKMVSIAYKSGKEKPLPLTESERKLEIDLTDLYEKLRGRNAVRDNIANVPYDDGQDY